YSKGGISFKSLSQWFPKVMSDSVKALRTEKDVKQWLVLDDKVPHVVFFTDKKTTPPLLKTLSIEFTERAALGVVLEGSDALAKKMGVRRRPAVIHIQDEDSLTGDSFDKDFKKEHVSRFLSRSVGKHRSEAGATLRELSSARYQAGDCKETDSNFCLILISGPRDDAAKASLRSVAQRLKRDPVKVFFVRDKGFVRAFGGK
ncbi:unnamed protein product, partial [Polarella glacialis]